MAGVIKGHPYGFLGFKANAIRMCLIQVQHGTCHTKNHYTQLAIRPSQDLSQ